MSTAAAVDPGTRALVALGAATARVAHELRNLLGGIDLAASILADQCAGDADLAVPSAQLLLGVQRLQAVAANILGSTRRVTLDTTLVDITTLARDTLAATDRAIPGTAVRLRLRLPDHKVWVLGDPGRLRQALLNLLLNALQAMPDGGVLSVRARTVGGHAELTVADTGVGMDRMTRTRAFEPFFTTRPTGTGLGLAVVREIAEAHGARVSMASRPGRGTIVRLRLPLAPEEGRA